MAKANRYAFVVAACCVLAVLFIFNPTEYAWMPKCPVKLLFGVDCPGCGVQRALHALLHGHIREAIGYNLFLVVAFPYLIAVLISDAMKEGNLRRKLRSIVESRWVTGGYIVIFFLWFIIRNINKS